MMKSLTFLIKFLIILSHNAYARSYAFPSGVHTYDEGKVACANLGMQLATIITADDCDALYADAATGGATYNTWSWIGIDDLASEGDFVWLDGTPCSYPNPDINGDINCIGLDETGDRIRWNGAGEPNDNGNGNWNCVNVRVINDGANEILASDSTCSTTRPVICSNIEGQSGAPTTEPTTFEPSQFVTTDSPTTAEPTSSSCGGANTYCYYVDLYPSGGINSVAVSLQSTNADTIEYFEIYIKSNGGVCNEPYLDITFQEIDYASGKPAEYFDVFDQNDSMIVTCEGTRDSQCTWLTCASGLDIGPSYIAADDTYQITVQTGYEHDPFCIQNSFTFNAIINVTCDSTLSPTSPTSPPITPQPTEQPTIEPTAPSVPTTAIPTTQDICNVSLNVVNDWPISKMNGWTICYDEPYADYTYPIDFSSCTIGDGYYLFVGAKETSTSQTFYVGAYAPSSVITTTTSSNTLAYLPSWLTGYNVYWYYYPGQSFGYAPIAAVTLSSADVYDQSDVKRLSWHFGQNHGGFRAGDQTFLNNDAVWRKVVYYKACSIAPTPPTTAYPTTNPTAVTSTPTPSPTNSRVSCGTYTWCYYVDLSPTNNITSETVQVYSETDSVVTYHNIYITSNGEDCINPTIDILFEEIDFSSPGSEYFDVFGENNYLISRCGGDQDSNCLFFETCLDDEYLPISQIDTNDTYQMVIQGSSGLNTLCDSYHTYSLNVELTINCGGDPRPPTTAQPTELPSTAPSRFPTIPPTNPTTAAPSGTPTTAAPTIRPNRTSCGTYTWCYYVDLYPSSTTKTSRSVAVYTIVENEPTFHRVYVTSNGNDCVNPRIDVIFEEIDMASSSEYFDVYVNNSYVIRCDGSRDAGCGIWTTCLDNYTLPYDQIKEGNTEFIEIQGSDFLNDFCIGQGNDNVLNVLLTITCGVSEEKYCDNVDCGWSFLCDEDTQSCVRDCDAFDIDGYLKCSESWAIVDANITSIVDRVGTIDEADESLDDLRAQLDEINEKIERLSRPFREELNGGHANINPMAQEITDDHSNYKYRLLNTFEPHDILIIVLLISNLILINYICLCQRNNKSGVKYIKTIQEENIEDKSESDSEASENEQLN